MTDVAIKLDEHNRDVLYAPRVELFFSPNPDGTPSLDGLVVFHTEWWHYSGGALRGKSRGPRIEHRVDAILGRSFDIGADEPLATLDIVKGVKAAFVVLAREQLGIEQDSPTEPPSE